MLMGPLMGPTAPGYSRGACSGEVAVADVIGPHCCFLARTGRILYEPLYVEQGSPVVPRAGGNKEKLNNRGLTPMGRLDPNGPARRMEDERLHPVVMQATVVTNA